MTTKFNYNTGSPEQLGRLVDKALRQPSVREYVKTIRSYEKPTGKPILAFCGYGKSGKDTAAEYLATVVDGWRYVGACSDVALPFVVAALGGSEEDFKSVFEERHSHRMFWFDVLNCVRSKLGQEILAMAMLQRGSSSIVGIRSGIELETVQRVGLVDLSVWIHRDVPVDPTVEYGARDCDVMIMNTQDLDTYHTKLRKFVRSLGYTLNSNS